MKKIISPMGAGKTTKLIELADGYDGYIVCIDRKEVDRVSKEAEKFKKKINQPITFDEFIQRQYGFGVKKFHIDNADMLLQRISLVPIESISMSL